MNIKWKKLVVRAGTWIALEVFFAYAGLDTIADYSEFVFDRNLMTLNG